MSSSIQDRQKPLITSFRERAKKLRRNAFINLFLIVTLLIVGVGVFIFAGTLANKESSQFMSKARLARLDHYKAEAMGLVFQIDRLEQQILETNNKLISEQAARGIINVALENQVDSLRNRDKDLNEQLRVVNEMQIKLQREIAESPAFDGQTILDQNQLWILVSAIATRIGAIILLLFLVKILVPLYHYNIKLASYYDARADALELVVICTGQDKAEIILEKLVGLLTPEHIDFGASPASPTDHVIELAKHVIEAKNIK